jgi:hypothetical protein
MTVRAIRVDPKDNVVVVAEEAGTGDLVHLDDGAEVRAVEAIPRGSKVAIAPIAEGEPVVRYGEEIGGATKDIAAGEYVHTHNLGRSR